MDVDQTTLYVCVGGIVLVQFMQTIQVAIVGRKLSRTLLPPPPQPTAAQFCNNCGALTHSSQLRDGMCPDCLGTEPTQRPRRRPR